MIPSTEDARQEARVNATTLDAHTTEAATLRKEQQAWVAAQQTVAQRKVRTEVEAKKAEEARRKECGRWGVDCRGQRKRFKRAVDRLSLRQEEEQKPIFAHVEPIEFDAPEVNEALGEDARKVLADGLALTAQHGTVTAKLGRFAIELGDKKHDLARVNAALRILSAAGLHRWTGRRWMSRLGVSDQRWFGEGDRGWFGQSDPVWFGQADRGPPLDG